MGPGTILDVVIDLVGGYGGEIATPSGFLVTMVAVAVIGYLVLGWLRS